MNMSSKLHTCVLSNTFPHIASYIYTPHVPHQGHGRLVGKYDHSPIFCCMVLYSHPQETCWQILLASLFPSEYFIDNVTQRTTNYGEPGNQAHLM